MVPQRLEFKHALGDSIFRSDKRFPTHQLAHPLLDLKNGRRMENICLELTLMKRNRIFA